MAHPLLRQKGRGDRVTLSDGRTGHIVGFDEKNGVAHVVVQLDGNGAADRQIVTVPKAATR